MHNMDMSIKFLIYKSIDFANTGRLTLTYQEMNLLTNLQLNDAIHEMNRNG